MKRLGLVVLSALLLSAGTASGKTRIVPLGHTVACKSIGAVIVWIESRVADGDQCFDLSPYEFVTISSAATTIHSGEKSFRVAPVVLTKPAAGESGHVLWIGF